MGRTEPGAVCFVVGKLRKALLRRKCRGTRRQACVALLKVQAVWDDHGNYQKHVPDIGSLQAALTHGDRV